jgi:Transposase zinc-binding domain/Phage integrase, N-terminal SAM-like domain
MTPLRQRFIDDLRVRNYSPRTIEAYVAGVARFAKHFGRSPELLGPDELRAFQIHLLEQRVSWSQFNQIVSALRLLYQHPAHPPDSQPARSAGAAATRSAGEPRGESAVQPAGCSSGGTRMSAPLVTRPALEVADVLREHGARFLDRYGSVLSVAQRKALRDLAACRTAALGGHVEHCLDCGHERIAYNSCRNRHCPKCQALARAAWLERQAEHLLAVEYHHVVFTLPALLGELALPTPRSFTICSCAAPPPRCVRWLPIPNVWGRRSVC